MATGECDDATVAAVFPGGVGARHRHAGRDGVGVELGAAGTSESTMAAGHVVPGATHLYDRGFVSFDLLRAVGAADADSPCG